MPDDVSLPERLRDAVHTDCQSNSKGACPFCIDLAVAASRIERLEDIVRLLRLVPNPSETGLKAFSMMKNSEDTFTSSQWDTIRSVQGYRAH